MVEWKHISAEFVLKFIQSSTKKPNFDHSLTVTPAVHHGKLNVLRYSKDPTTREILTTTEAVKLMFPFRQ